MKNLLLLIALTIICLSCRAQSKLDSAQIAENMRNDPKAQGIRPNKPLPNKPKTYSIGLLVDSLQYVQLTQEFTKAEILLDNSKGLDHAEVKATISFIEQLKTLFAKQKELQDKASK